MCYPELTPFTEYYLFRPYHQQAVLQAVKKTHAGEPVDWRRIRCYGRLMLAADKSGFKAQLLLDREMVQETEVETLVNGTRDFLAKLPRGPKGGALHVYWTTEIGGYSFT